MSKNKTTMSSLALTIIVFLISLIPFLYDVLISFKEYTPFKGLANSPFIGQANYQKFFSSYYFSKLLTNTIVQSLLFCLFLFIISLILGFIIVSLPSRSILSGVIVTFTLIILFIPDVVYVGWFINLPLSSKPFLMPNIALWFIPLIRSIKYIGIPVLTTSIIYNIRRDKDFFLPFKVGACFALFSIMFIAINDITITFLTSNPLILEVIDSFNLYTYKSGLVNAGYSEAAAVTVISRLLSLVSVGIFFIPFKILAKDLFGNNTFGNLATEMENPKGRSLSTSIAIVLMLIVAAIPYIAKNINIFDMKALSLILQNPNAIRTIPLYLLISVIAASINVGLSAILAHPIVCGGKNLKTTSIVLLLLMGVLASAPVSIGSFLIIKGLGLYNTIYAVLFSLISPIAGVWAFVAIANSQGVPENGGYAKSISKPSIALILIQMVYSLNNYLPSLIHISDRRLYSPALMYRELALVGGEAARQLPQYGGMIFWYSIILSIIPVGILIVLRISLTETSLFSMLGMSQRK